MNKYARFLPVEDDYKPGDIVHLNGMCLDQRTATVYMFGRTVRLGPKQAQILATMMANPGQFFSRKDLLELCDFTTETYERTIDSHIKRLRIALFRDNSALARQVIRAKYSIGYCMPNLRQ